MPSAVNWRATILRTTPRSPGSHHDQNHLELGDRLECMGPIGLHYAFHPLEMKASTGHLDATSLSTLRIIASQGAVCSFSP